MFASEFSWNLSRKVVPEKNGMKKKIESKISQMHSKLKIFSDKNPDLNINYIKSSKFRKKKKIFPQCLYWLFIFMEIIKKKRGFLWPNKS